MTPEELMKPRYKVIADYPACPYEIGTILIPDEQGELYSTVAGYSSSLIKVMEGKAGDFPHLFQPLRWWEERKIEEMPEYIREVDSLYKIGEVIMVAEWEIESEEQDLPCFRDEKDNHFTWVRGFVPATREEYEQYKQKEVDNEHGICKECNKQQATVDYNGHEHWVCDQCNETLNNEFDREYQ